ncbi:uncharacterized protein [Porites lutea]|uniref:uncharacterized protein n=1 Tax=Porites lutea TaxID=51062 RepID=UPI003CC695D3
MPTLWKSANTTPIHKGDSTGSWKRSILSYGNTTSPLKILKLKPTDKEQQLDYKKVDVGFVAQQMLKEKYILPLKILTQVNPFQELTHCCMNTWLEISNRLKCQWSVVKLLLLQVMSHGQSTVNRGFSVNKEVAVENFSDRLFIAQRIIHGHIESVGGLVNWHI